MAKHRPVVLLIIDGFGIAPAGEGNAVAAAQMPVFRKLTQSYPAMTIQASGEAVGLSWGEMGNSEVGHLTIGAGRIFYQSLPRINLSIATEDFYKNPVLLKAIEHIKTTDGKLHFMGLVSPGGVHASEEHLYALLDFCHRQKVSTVFIHAFLDGRDSIYNSAAGFIKELEAKMREFGVGQIATLSGRYYAMDRDNRWDRIEKAYNAITQGQGEQVEKPDDAIQASYAKGIYDEQFVPTVITKKGQPIAKVEEGDAVVFFNFRTDRARELTKAFVLPAFDKFPRTQIKNLFFGTFTEYEKDLPVEVIFPPQLIENCLAKVISDAGLKQLHIAETEKYAHVTFFLNGMREDEFPGEDRVIIPSPRVSTYDQEPEMSVFKIADRIEKEIGAGTYDFVVANFANPDMVGHTGNEEATVKACQAVDEALGRIVNVALAVDGAVVITADHGNAEEVKNLMTGEMDKEHSTNPVPCVIVAHELEGLKAPGGDVVGDDLSLAQPVGMLADVAPTICKLMEIPQAPEMSGTALI
ncbi:MAG TPA: 2,3-bisphosphoglycerate-independent phosphoglycerate mutase [Patescibacteria group bacterium]|nr:2,3-bisphosphoglycerate-independent phosphoglycerate mutase [Patescibacteria group bacterium]